MISSLFDLRTVSAMLSITEYHSSSTSTGPSMDEKDKEHFARCTVVGCRVWGLSFALEGEAGDAMRSGWRLVGLVRVIDFMS
jgi:hypothetical protein